MSDRSPEFVDLIIQIANGIAVSAEVRAGINDDSGGTLRKLKRYEEVITAYQQANKPPESAYAIAECMLLNGQLPAAIRELAGIENLFKDQGAEGGLHAGGVLPTS